jgi:glucose/arabinose dehydrogenase
VEAMNERRRRSRSAIVTILALAALAWSAAAPLTVSGAFAITLSPFASGFNSPTQITSARDGTNRLFVVEQRGVIKAIAPGGAVSTFMDIRTKVEDGGERGLLGLAFDPNFKWNGRLFVYYTRNGGDIVVSRFVTNAAHTNVIESSARPLLLIEHSANTNHNGGALAFGPHSYLYVGTGDGGGSGDPANNGQKKSTLLGKILRINVNGTGSGPFDHYSIPKSNPFWGASRPGLGEIWDYGLRNPWRISFDRGSGKLFIADVGQGRYEEINRERAGFTGGRNYGWDAMEGMHCFTASKCPLAGDTLPNAEYSHSGGNCSITGGYVYRGPTQTALVGLYVFADWCSGKIWTIPYNGLAVNTPETLRADTSQQITSFGESENGELYAVTSDGDVYQVLAS